MLIGQAPGRLEVSLGLPFAGDAGKRLVGWLAVAGVTVQDFRERWYVSSVGKCHPGRAAGSSTDLPPSRAEIERWGPYLADELRLVAPRLVVLVGALAHRFAFGPQPVDQLVGRDLTLDGATAICLPHPSGASTWLYRPGHVELWRGSLALVAERWRDLRSDRARPQPPSLDSTTASPASPDRSPRTQPGGRPR